MNRYSLFVACIAILATCNGCIPWGNYYTVPWWKGAPASLIAPSSLEAMAWKEQMRQGHQQYQGERIIHVDEDSGDETESSR